MAVEGNAAHDQLLGCATVLEACAGVLADRPTAESLSCLQQVAAVAGWVGFERFSAGVKLDQLFDQRFLVAGGSLYVPLSENSVRHRKAEAGRVAHGPVEGAYSAHVAACYEAAGFNWRDAMGNGLFAHAAPPDTLAAELLFTAWLVRSWVQPAESGAEQQSCHAAVLAKQFCEQHLSRWASDAAALLAVGEEDLFSQAAGLAAQTTEVLMGELPRA